MKNHNNETTLSSYRFRTQYFAPVDPSVDFEPVNDLPSETVPDYSYTVKDIIAQFVRGIAPPVRRDVSYPDIPDDADPFDFIDPTERMDFDLSDYGDLRRDLDSRLSSPHPIVPNDSVSDTSAPNVPTLPNDTEPTE